MREEGEGEGDSVVVVVAVHRHCTIIVALPYRASWLCRLSLFVVS